METKRLIIDPLKETDKAAYFRNTSHDKKVLKTFICRYTETMDDLDFSEYLTERQKGRIFAIRLKETGNLIGILTCFAETDRSCEIGYGIGSGYWDRGYATEAVKRFLAYLLNERHFQTVYASFFTGNAASRRVMEKAGMTWNRSSEKELTYLGVERDLMYYSISRNDQLVPE